MFAFSGYVSDTSRACLIYCSLTFTAINHNGPSRYFFHLHTSYVEVPHTTLSDVSIQA